ncbi:hypothetical protein ACRCUN_08490 [Mycobacterium sp. LTG2003]
MRPANDTFRDHAEKLREFATGRTRDGLSSEARKRIQERWRQHRTENPYLHHLWWISDEEKARAAGRTHFQAICKAMIRVPEQLPKVRGTICDENDMVAPTWFHDVDREDPDTGLYWFDVDCVDCLSRANAIALQWQREELAEKLQAIVEKVSTLDARTVISLLSQFQELESGA